MGKYPSKFENLLKQAEELMMSSTSAEQVVAVRTSKGNIFCFANHNISSGNTADETEFVKILKANGDTEILHVVCIWRGSVLDVPSYHLRGLLADLNPLNQETEVLLSDGEGFAVKPLKVMLR